MDNRCWYVPKQDGRESQDPVERGRLEICLVSSVEEVTGAISGKGSRKRGLYQHGSALLLADEGIWTEAVHQCPLSHPL